jgi:hypothetical protein
MKNTLTFVFLFFLIKTPQAQFLEFPNKKSMIDNIKTVKTHSLKYLPQLKALHSFEERKFLGPIQNNVITKGIFLIQNLNGKQFYIPLDGLFSTNKNRSNKRTQVISDSLPQARLLYNTDKGKVYALPFDNMPCLVPDEMYSFNYPKNYKQYYPKGSIPNPYSRYDLIPGRLHGKVSGIKISPIPNNYN